MNAKPDRNYLGERIRKESIGVYRWAWVLSNGFALCHTVTLRQLKGIIKSARSLTP